MFALINFHRYIHSCIPQTFGLSILAPDAGLALNLNINNKTDASPIEFLSALNRKMGSFRKESLTPFCILWCFAHEEVFRELWKKNRHISKILQFWQENTNYVDTSILLRKFKSSHLTFLKEDFLVIENIRLYSFHQEITPCFLS